MVATPPEVCRHIGAVPRRCLRRGHFWREGGLLLQNVEGNGGRRARLRLRGQAVPNQGRYIRRALLRSPAPDQSLDQSPLGPCPCIFQECKPSRVKHHRARQAANTTKVLF